MCSPKLGACALVLALAACHGELVPVDDGDGASVDGGEALLTWEGEVQALVASCTGCHGDDGNYSLETYQATLGSGSDQVANVIAGDAGSALLDYAARGHGGLGDAAYASLSRWVMEAEARER